MTKAVFSGENDGQLTLIRISKGAISDTFHNNSVPPTYLHDPLT